MERKDIRAEMTANKIVLQVELWQSQNYWPIKGWGSPLSGVPHYASVLLTTNGCEAFPDDLAPPKGWDWADRWSVDTSSRYGTADAEGWFYSATFDRLNETIRSGTASGVVNKTSIVRKRRWLRSILCTSVELYENIQSRIYRIMEMRNNIELSMKNREEAYRSVKFYEENRSFVFAQSLHLATQGSLNTLSILKELGNKLKLFKLYIHDRVALERDHSKRMESLGRKYWSQCSPLNAGDASYVLLSPSSSSTTPTQQHEHTDELKTVLYGADMFFSKIFLASQANVQSVNDFSMAILHMVEEEVDAMLGELQQVLKESRAIFRKNSDMCRLSEAAVRNFLQCVHIAHDSSIQSSLKEIQQLCEEMNGLKGSAPFHHAYFTNVHALATPRGKREREDDALTLRNVIDFSDEAPTQPGDTTHTTETAERETPTDLVLPHILRGEAVTLAALDVAATQFSTLSLFPHMHLHSGSSVAVTHKAIVSAILTAPREDVWLGVQRYKAAVRDSQEALCVLIAEAMDLELQRQIIANRVHQLFTACIKQYATQELTLLSELHTTWTQCMRDCLQSIKLNGLPFPVLQSPFSKLNLVLDTAASAEKKKDRGDAAEEALVDEEFMNNVGIFSFTTLFREPLPQCPGVVLSGDLLCASIQDFMRVNSSAVVTESTGEEGEDVWKSVYVVATVDGYLHVVVNKKSDIPDRSYYLKQCVLNAHLRELHGKSVWHEVFEVSYSPLLQQQKNKQMFVDGLVFRPADSAAHGAWLNALVQLTTSTVHADEVVESATQLAMLDVLPVLRGESEKMELSLSLQAQQQQEGAHGESAVREDEEVERDAEEEKEKNESENENENESDTSSEYETHTSPTQNSLSTEPVTAAAVSTQNDESVPVSVRGEGEERETERARDTPQPRALPATPFSAGSVKSRAAAFSTLSPPPSATTTPTSSSSSSSAAASLWKRRENAAVSPPPLRTALVSGVVPVAEIKPKQIIPVQDTKVPLARKHSQLIAQYEQGLKQDKEKHTNRVAETRGKRMKDFLLDEDEELDTQSSHGVDTPTPESASKTSVRALSQRFDPAALAAAGMTTPLRERETEREKERASRSESPIPSVVTTTSEN